MSRLGRLARRLVIIWGIAAGCDGGTGSGTPTTTTTDPTPAEVVAAIKSDLASLTDLHVFGVGGLVVSNPEASNCYGGAPCADLVSNPAVAAEYARQAPRLRQLTQLAQELAATADLPAAGADTTADLAALNNLAIVYIGQLVTVAPASSPICYNTPCPDDIARADAENRHHADVVHALATGSVYLAP